MVICQHRCIIWKVLYSGAGSTISNGREPESCLGWVFNAKLVRIALLRTKCMTWHAATARVENSAQGSSCQLKFVHVWSRSDRAKTFYNVDTRASLGRRGTSTQIIRAEESLEKKTILDFMRESYGRGRISTVELLVLTRFHQLLLDLLFTKQGTLMMGQLYWAIPSVSVLWFNLKCVWERF